MAYDKYSGLDHRRKRDETRQYDYVSVPMRLDNLRGLIGTHTDDKLLDILTPDFFLQMFFQEENNQKNPDRGAIRASTGGAFA